MSAKPPNSRSNMLRKSWLDLAAITAWGVLLIKYSIDGTLGILIHPSYYTLATVTGCCLVIIGGLQGWRLYRSTSTGRIPANQSQELQHISLLPHGVTTMLLLGTAIAGLMITPRLFTSHTAIQRGVSAEAVTVTRNQTQAFRTSAKPEAKTLIDWVRTLSIYPEPDAYVGQKVNVNGFVLHPSELPGNYLSIARFVITCCAADAYPVALPVKFGGNRQTYPQDSWLQVRGKMTTETLQGKRQLVIAATELKPISAPRNPYQD
jgi:uncharacterized repeat protein (TIGR03943 family)